MPTWITECLGIWLVLTIVSVTVGATMGFFDGMVDIANERKALKAKEELEMQREEALCRTRMQEVAREDLRSRCLITLGEYRASCNDTMPMIRVPSEISTFYADDVPYLHAIKAMDNSTVAVMETIDKSDVPPTYGTPERR